MIVVVALLAFAIGFGVAVVANRSRWLIFPISGGSPLLGWMGGPAMPSDASIRDALGAIAPLDVPCEHCGAPAGVTCPHDNATKTRATLALPCNQCDAVVGDDCPHLYEGPPLASLVGTRPWFCVDCREPLVIPDAEMEHATRTGTPGPDREAWLRCASCRAKAGVDGDPRTFGVICSRCDRVYTHVQRWSDAPAPLLCPTCQRAGEGVDLGFGD